MSNLTSNLIFLPAPSNQASGSVSERETAQLFNFPAAGRKQSQKQSKRLRNPREVVHAETTPEVEPEIVELRVSNLTTPPATSNEARRPLPEGKSARLFMFPGAGPELPQQQINWLYARKGVTELAEGNERILREVAELGFSISQWRDFIEALRPEMEAFELYCPEPGPELVAKSPKRSIDIVSRDRLNRLVQDLISIHNQLEQDLGCAKAIVHSRAKIARMRAGQPAPRMLRPLGGFVQNEQTERLISFSRNPEVQMANAELHLTVASKLFEHGDTDAAMQVVNSLTWLEFAPAAIEEMLKNRRILELRVTNRL